MKKVPFKITAALFALALCPSWSRADNPGDYLRTRTYIGLFGSSVSVAKDGEFTGLNYSRNNSPYEIDLIPALSQNFGFGVLIGHRDEAWAGELSFWQSSHTATFGPGTVGSISGGSVTFNQAVEDTATYQSINLDFKRYFLTELQIQPFVNLGVAFPWVTVKNASSDPSGNTGDLTLAGLGLNLGTGAEYYVTPEFSVTGGLFYRFASFDQAKGVGGVYYPMAIYGNQTSDEGSGFTFTLGTSVGFQ
ncbi:MAG TPA: hypothetical protein VHE12_01290 [bacterium]|nr:hypothetical protein [bacterium]